MSALYDSDSKTGKTRILILDDEPIVCKRLRPAFQKAGYEVEAFTDSASAMARIDQKRFDVVITGFATPETAKESFRKGAFDFVAKPFKMSDIMEAVRQIVGKRGH